MATKIYVPKDDAERRLDAEQESRFDDDGNEIVEIATCGTCHRSWNDAAISQWTPAPSSRCPFEYEHETVEDHLEVQQLERERKYAPYCVERIYDGCYHVLDEEGAIVAKVAKFMPGPMVCVDGNGVYSPQLARAIAATMVVLAGELKESTHTATVVTLALGEGQEYDATCSCGWRSAGSFTRWNKAAAEGAKHVANRTT